MAITHPRVFISYSWTSAGHQDHIRSMAEQLIADGIEVTLDQWDLKEGQDKYHFMESMVVDPTFTHVLIFSDSEYARKADQKKGGGVGTESQIISREVYDKVEQTKFIPIACEKDENGEPCLPTFLKSRIWIDLSSPELTAENWEKLIRLVFGKPALIKPSLGAPPAFLEDEDRPALPTVGRFNVLKSSIAQSKPNVPSIRHDYIESVIGFLNGFRLTEAPPTFEEWETVLLADLHRLLPLRDQLIDWISMESESSTDDDLEAVLIKFLEKLLETKYRAPNVSNWNESWSDANRILVYELFLYLIGTLVRQNRLKTVHFLLTTSYMVPLTSNNPDRFENVRTFFGYSEILDNRNKRLTLNRMSPLADLMKERASRQDVPFNHVMEAEVIILLIGLITDKFDWFPHTLVYAGYGARFPFFIRATRHRDFEKVKTLTGFATKEELVAKVEEMSKERSQGHRGFNQNYYRLDTIRQLINLDALDTLD